MSWERHGFQVGDVLPDAHEERVRVMRVIAEGGYSVVYAGRRERSGTECAIKALRLKHAGNRKEVERLLREGKALYALRHPCVVPVTYIGMRVKDELIYLVMKLLKGRNLRELQQDVTASRQGASEGKHPRRHGKLPVSWVLEIGIPMCSGLDAIHTKAFAIHRDLKPENTYVEDDGSVLLFDIGSAKFTKNTRLTTNDTTLGTPQYMSPEQVYTPTLADYRSDLFSLGAILYELLTGVSPFAPAPGQSNDPQEQAVRIVFQPHRPLAEAAPHVPLYIVEIVERLLRKKASERYPSAARVRELLAAALARFRSELGDLAPLPLAQAVVTIPRTIPEVAADPVELPPLPTSTNPFLTISLPPELPPDTAADTATGATTEEFPAPMTLLPPDPAEVDGRPVYVFVPPPASADPSSGTAAPQDPASPDGVSIAPAPAPQPEPAPASPDEQSKRLAAALRRYIAELPVDLRQAFVLSQIHEMPIDEIAEAIGVPAETVRERVLEARARLGARMKEEAAAPSSDGSPETGHPPQPADDAQDESPAQGERAPQSGSESDGAGGGSQSLSSHVREVPPGRPMAPPRGPTVRRIAVASGLVALVAGASYALVRWRGTEAPDRDLAASVTVTPSASSSAGAPPTSIPAAPSAATAASPAPSPLHPVASPGPSVTSAATSRPTVVAVGRSGGMPVYQKPAAPPLPTTSPPPTAAPHRVFGSEN